MTDKELCATLIKIARKETTNGAWCFSENELNKLLGEDRAWDYDSLEDLADALWYLFGDWMLDYEIYQYDLPKDTTWILDINLGGCICDYMYYDELDGCTYEDWAGAMQEEYGIRYCELTKEDWQQSQKDYEDCTKLINEILKGEN